MHAPSPIDPTRTNFGDILIDHVYEPDLCVWGTSAREFVQTFTEGLLTYGTGRTLEYYDMPTVRRIMREAQPGGYRFSTLVQAVVKSDQFRMRRVPQAAAPESKVARLR